MRMPGFTAEVSLSDMSGHHRWGQTMAITPRGASGPHNPSLPTAPPRIYPHLIFNCSLVRYLENNAFLPICMYWDPTWKP